MLTMKANLPVNNGLQLSGVGVRKFGTSADEVLNGSAYNDEIHGGAGRDIINSGNGNDVLFGDAGSDQLNGGNGNDTLEAARITTRSSAGPAPTCCSAATASTSRAT